MKGPLSRHFYKTVGSVCALLAGLFFLGSKWKGSHPDGFSKLFSEKSGIPGDLVPETTGSGRPRTDSGRPRDPRLANYFAGGMTFFKADRFDRYLSANKRSARSLLSVFRLTNDESILEELKTSHGNDPEVMWCFATCFQLEPRERLASIKKFIEEKPGNAEAYLIAAAMSGVMNESREHIHELVDAASRCEQLTVGSEVATNDMREALKSIDMDETQTEIQLAIHNHFSLTILGISLTAMQQDCLSALDKAQSDEEKQKALGSFLSVADSFKEMYSYMDSSMNFYSSVSEVLKTVDPQFNLGKEHGTSMDYLQKAEIDRDYNWNLWVASNDFLYKASPAQVDEFFRRKANLGGEAAREWLANECPAYQDRLRQLKAINSARQNATQEQLAEYKKMGMADGWENAKKWLIDQVNR